MRSCFAAAALALVLSGRPAGAQETARCEARAYAIAAVLDEDERRTRVWYWAWMAAGVGLIGGQAALAAASSGDAQKDFIAGAATSLLIPAILLTHPPAVLSDGPLLDARVAATRVGGRLGDPCVVLLRGQELLRRDAADQALLTGWLSHVVAIGGNVAVGLLLGLAFHDWFGAVKQAVGGSAVGELQIWTLPTAALTARGLEFSGSF